MSKKCRPVCSPLLAAAALLLVSVTTPLAASAQSEGETSTLYLTANDVEYAVDVRVPPNWSIAPQIFENARSLHDVAPGASESPSTNIQIYVEPRLDHADALNQIREAATSVPDEDKVVTEIGGWPAVRVTLREERPQPSQGPAYESPEVLRILTYIAVEDTLFVATGVLPTDASPELIEAVVDISSSLRFGSASDAGSLGRDLDLLRTPFNSDAGAAPGAGAPASVFTATTAAEAGAPEAGAVAGSNVRINANGFGELEIAVSPDGLNVVVALQARRFVSSNDGGGTFPNAGTVGSGNGDPSIAIGQSGDFYLAWIDTNCGSNYVTFNVGTLPAQPFGYDCTGIARSTDNGVTFQTNTVNPAVVCIGRAPSGGVDPAGACFPDQEHIAADPVNAGLGGDQIYSTWRNFNSANQDAGLVCSQDNGVTWTAPITLGANSFFPRITVGQDGFVYVAAFSGANYRLWKYSSCASGLNLQAGFPVNVAPRTPYVCPFAGHDRCDQNPSSQTVAVDDTNPNHIYYAFAQDDTTDGTNSYSRVIVRDSTDGGLTWPAARVVTANSTGNARRIMPWMCVANGDAVLTWYEQASPVPSDATHHIGAQVGLDAGSNLISKDLFQISEVSDNWCNTGWQCGTRQTSASESCPIQPQLAGFCGDGNPATPDSNIRCDFSDEAAAPQTLCLTAAASPSGNDEICLTGGGCPKYGDYNGNACTGFTLHAAWPSANSPPGVPGPTTATNTGVLYSTVALNGPPVCDANGPYIAECGVLAATALDGSASSDPDGGALTFLWTGAFDESPIGGPTPSVTFGEPLGDTIVNLLVTDTGGLTDSCTADVTVQDTLPPSITAPADITAECADPAGTPVALGTPAFDDLCDSNLAVGNDAPGPFPLGMTTVTWTATDDGGNSASDTQVVTIEDTTPPVIACNDPGTIIPPDAPIPFTATADDLCQGPITPVVTGFDCFKINKKGKVIGKTASCIVSFIGDTVTISDSGGVGTMIQWTVEATDPSGNTSTETCEVEVVNPSG